MNIIRIPKKIKMERYAFRDFVFTVMTVIVISSFVILLYRYEISYRFAVPLLTGKFGEFICVLFVIALGLVWHFWMQLKIARRMVADLKKLEYDLKNAYSRLMANVDTIIHSQKKDIIYRLAGSIAHEIRNPLTTIVQGISYLENNIHSADPRFSETLIMIKNNVKRADRVIDLLLGFSEEVEKIDLQPQDLKSILAGSLRLLKAKSNLKGIKVVQNIEKDIPDILADKEKIEESFLNVFTNAVESMSGSGKLSINCRTEKLSGAMSKVCLGDIEHFDLGERVVRVEIKDTGVGIPDENMRKMFDPFFSTKASSDMSGLGLFVVLNMVHLHRAFVEVSSQVGEGTKVTFTFKIAEET
jgi:signal transduction histidine kinase